MRIFWAFLILVTAALLWLVPITDLIYSFQTDVKTDSFYVATGAGITDVTVILRKAVYNNDTSTLTVFSSNNTDLPSFVSYNTITRATVIDGLTENTTRALEITYDTDALNASPAWNNILGKVPLIWMVLIIAFPVAGLAAIFVGRA